MSDRARLPRHRFRVDGRALLYLVANAAQCSGGYYVLFPGLAALSHDVLTRPWVTLAFLLYGGGSSAKDAPVRVSRHCEEFEI